jgi:hypothetical protein
LIEGFQQLTDTHEPERRMSPRKAISIPATLEALDGNRLRYRGTILNLSALGCLLRLPSTQRLPKQQWEIAIESPLDEHSLASECVVVGVRPHKTDDIEDVGLRFVSPTKGFQEAIVSFQSNLARLLMQSFRVHLSAILLPQQGLLGLESSVPVAEMGGDFMTVTLKDGRLVVSQPLVTRIISPDFREELRLPATVASVERVPEGQRARLVFESWDASRLAFAKRHMVKVGPKTSRWTPRVTARIYGRGAAGLPH